MLYRFYNISGETESGRSFPYLTQKPFNSFRFAPWISPSPPTEARDEIANRVAAIIASRKTARRPQRLRNRKTGNAPLRHYPPMCRHIFEVLHQVPRLRIVREMNIAQPDMLLDALPE